MLLIDTANIPKSQRSPISPKNSKLHHTLEKQNRNGEKTGQNQKQNSVVQNNRKLKLNFQKRLTWS